MIRIIEVSPRDGLQNEAEFIPTTVKVEFINRLSRLHFSAIETTSFVSPKWIPQLADHTEVFEKIHKNPQIHYPVLVPNMQGFEAALAAGVREIAVFTAASNSFAERNINCTIEESFIRLKPVIDAAQKNHIRVRGYVSCVLGCPYEGEIDIEYVAAVADRLYQLGCYEISLGDTIGVGTPLKAQKMVEKVMKKIPLNGLAGHFHDTYGQALANIFAVMQLGMTAFDSSVSGLGGCPYAKGAAGNVATEDLVYMLEGMGINTGINLDELIDTGLFICNKLGKPTRSKAALALIAKRKAHEK